MKHLISISLFCSAVALSGCVSHPQNAKEFRSAVQKGAMFMTTENYALKRPYSDVVASLKKYSSKCLEVTVASTTPIGGMARTATISQEYHPKLIAGKNQAEFYLQYYASAHAVSKIPEGGYYYLVVDFIKEGKSITRVNYYGPSGDDPMAKAVKGWASGEIRGCVDLTK